VLQCKNAQRVWTNLGLNNVQHEHPTITEFMEQTITLQECTWPICFWACLLHLWKTRNDRIFNNRAARPVVIFQHIAGELKLWATRAHKDKVGIGQWVQKIQS
jgi:hypothetical protein